MVNADHILHYTPDAEGYGTYRLECVQGIDYPHVSWEEDYEHRNPCRCIAVDHNDCEDCRNDDHGACGFYGAFIFELGYSCQCIARPDICWAVDWLGNVGDEWIAGGDWKEDGPWYVHADPEEGLLPVDMDAERQKLLDRLAAGLYLPPGVAL